MFANGIPIKRESTKDITPFRQEEIQLLWDNIQLPFADMVLVGIYSGWRPQELAILKISDIDLDANTMNGGLKTDAGKNRMKDSASHSSTFLFNDENGQQGTHMTYDKYRKRFQKKMDRLNLSHRPHETRHTFITKAKECQVDEYILKLIVGHAITDIIEKTYTHRTIEQLHAEIAKISE